MRGGRGVRGGWKGKRRKSRKNRKRNVDEDGLSGTVTIIRTCYLDLANFKACV